MTDDDFDVDLAPIDAAVVAEFPPERLLDELVGLRNVMHGWTGHLARTQGVDSLAFRKAYDVEQRLANACHDAMALRAALTGPPRSFRGGLAKS